MVVSINVEKKCITLPGHSSDHVIEPEPLYVIISLVKPRNHNNARIYHLLLQQQIECNINAVQCSFMHFSFQYHLGNRATSNDS